MKYLFYLVHLSFFLWVSYRLPATAQNQRVNFEHLTIEDGLSHNFVMYVMQDRKGFLWFGTGSGMDKYDGYRFTNYKFDPQDSTTVPKNQVFKMWEDSEGMIWIGSSEVTSRFDPRTETFTRLEKSADNPYAFKFAQSFNEDAEGNIWVTGSFEGEIRQIDRKTGRFSATNYAEMLASVSGNDYKRQAVLHFIYKDRKGVLWFGSPNGLHRLTLTPQGKNKPSTVSFTHFRLAPEDSATSGQKNNPTVNEVGNNITGIYEDSKGVFWVLSRNGKLYTFQPKTGKFTQFQTDNFTPIKTYSLLPNCFAEDLEGNLWISSYNGLYKLNSDLSQITSFLNDSIDPGSLTHNNVPALIVDNSGILWIATQNGVNKLDPHIKRFEVYAHNPQDPHSLSNNNISAICEDKQGLVWVGTLKAGLNVLNKSTGQFTHYQNNSADDKSLRSDEVGAILEDRNGNLWVGNYTTLSLFNRATNDFTHFTLNHLFLEDNDGTSIFSMYEARDGLLWLGTNNGMLSFDPKTGKTVSYPYDPDRPERMTDWWALTILEDSRGNLWIGAGSQALNRLDRKTGAFTHYSYDYHKRGSISSNTVQSIYEDTKGNLWFGTGEGGLCLFDYVTETFTAYTEKHGLSGNSVFSILDDSEGNLWLGTNNGLSKFSTITKIFTNYDASDGLKSKMFNTLYTEAAAFKGKDGILYFGGNNGLTVFNPVTIDANTFVPPVVITQFSLFDKPLAGKHQAKEIELAYDENFFSVEFAALNFTNTNKNQYAYQLEGVDKDWVYTGSRRFASYTDIGPGNYTFRVRGSNNDGIWNEQATTLTIIIHPPWWRTTWAYGFYFLCFLAVVFAVDRYQRHRLIAKEREKAQEKELAQAKEIEKAYYELKRTQTQLIQSEKMASLGELTAGIAHEIQNPLNFVNNFSEVSTELIQELKEEISHDHKQDALALADDLTQNLSKIQHHGKRADSIVKGMLQHSRVTSREKQLIDLNALVDEYLRLAYHGLRAKEKDFNAEFRFDADPAVGSVSVVPQEIGRVLLNLFNNAFYAVNQKKQQPNEPYQPQVIVTTKKLGDKVEIRVKDNGTGIPVGIRQKIFQPFFTTKPTGEGTGLGLSLSYDIITKGHGGKLNVESVEGEFTEMIIELPKD
ncbi:histidine kinase [Rhodocytophaga rosea]|uniref:histidine kinase n=1 Tax=Rhodocytophaga rosea TaxID=2704465 RepID=A0A6C0GPA8_9BACT|nr:sensor histidine kinase [Rhodocytophaga rosea]QHT69757.1 histidine kinase [Rhodocytophaga rosea]